MALLNLGATLLMKILWLLDVSLQCNRLHETWHVDTWMINQWAIVWLYWVLVSIILKFLPFLPFFFFFHFTVNLEYGFLKQESVMLGVSCFLSLNALFHLSLTASPAGSGDLTDAMSVRVTGNPFFCCMHGLLIAGEDLLLYVLCV